MIHVGELPLEQIIDAGAHEDVVMVCLLNRLDDELKEGRLFTLWRVQLVGRVLNRQSIRTDAAKGRRARTESDRHVDRVRARGLTIRGEATAAAGASGRRLRRICSVRRLPHRRRH